jgi:hypothetical protein
MKTWSNLLSEQSAHIGMYPMDMSPIDVKHGYFDYEYIEQIHYGKIHSFAVITDDVNEVHMININDYDNEVEMIKQFFNFLNGLETIFYFTHYLANFIELIRHRAYVNNVTVEELIGATDCKDFKFNFKNTLTDNGYFSTVKLDDTVYNVNICRGIMFLDSITYFSKKPDVVVDSFTLKNVYESVLNKGLPETGTDVDDVLILKEVIRTLKYGSDKLSDIGFGVISNLKID